MEQKQKKIVLPDKAFLKAQSYCAYQERCQQEVRDKLHEWGLHSADVENIIAKLIEENFLNEERFAIAYAGGKFRIKKWGKVRIRLELKKRKISDYCIRKALNQIEETDYLKALKSVLESKAKSSKGLNKIRKNYVTGKYAISRGFEPELVWDVLRLNEG